MNELVTLRKIEQSKLAIKEVKTLGEIKNLIDQSEALKAYARSAQMSAEIQADITELNLIAERRLGEISVALESKKGGDRRSINVRKADIENTKTATLSSIGVSRQRANEAEKLSAIEEDVFNDLIKSLRKIHVPKTDILELARIAPEKQRAVADKIAAGEAKKVSEAVRQIKIETAKDKILKQGDKNPIKGTLYEGDLFQELHKIPAQSIDLLFVDPPYMIIDEKWDRFENLINFMEFTHKWLSEVVKKVKATGRIYICFSQFYQYELFDLLRDNNFYGFNFGQTIIWHYRNNNKPSDRKLYRFAYEPIFYLYGKDASELNFQAETYGEMQFNVWTIATPQSNFAEGKFHPAQKPLELLERIIMTGCKESDIVLDPFAGSGTTGVAAQSLNRNYILIEKEKEYCKIIRGRLNG